MPETACLRDGRTTDYRIRTTDYGIRTTSLRPPGVTLAVVAALALAIRDVNPETPRTRRVWLSLDGAPFVFRAGQAVRVGLAGQPLRKPYSIACSPEQARETDTVELLVQVGADGSAGTHLGAPSAGLRVAIDGPFGDFRFPDAPAERRFLFVAGGTGIAPLRAMLWHALSAFPGREAAVVYSVRSPDEFAFGDELRELARGDRIVLRETVTREAGPLWTGGRGRVTRAHVAALVADVPALCFVCGPPPLVQDVTGWLLELGVTKERILSEGWV